MAAEQVVFSGRWRAKRPSQELRTCGEAKEKIGNNYHPLSLVSHYFKFKWECKAGR